MTPQERELMQMALDALEKNKRTHYYCEDTWYSCPKHEDGCANDAEGDECNCGADRINTVLDKTIKALRARLEQPEQAPTNNGRYLTGYKAQPEQEPVAWQCQEHGDKEWFNCSEEAYGINPRRYIYRPLYTAPPQREWQGLTDEEYNAIRYGHDENGEPYVDYELFEEGEYGMEVNIYVDDFARAIEAKLKEKNA